MHHHGHLHQELPRPPSKPLPSEPTTYSLLLAPTGTSLLSVMRTCHLPTLVLVCVRVPLGTSLSARWERVICLPLSLSAWGSRLGPLCLWDENVSSAYPCPCLRESPAWDLSVCEMRTCHLPTLVLVCVRVPLGTSVCEMRTCHLPTLVLVSVRVPLGTSSVCEMRTCHLPTLVHVCVRVPFGTSVCEMRTCRLLYPCPCLCESPTWDLSVCEMRTCHLPTLVLVSVRVPLGTSSVCEMRTCHLPTLVLVCVRVPLGTSPSVRWERVICLPLSLSPWESRLGPLCLWDENVSSAYPCPCLCESPAWDLSICEMRTCHLPTLVLVCVRVPLGTSPSVRWERVICLPLSLSPWESRFLLSLCRCLCRSLCDVVTGGGWMFRASSVISSLAGTSLKKQHSPVLPSIKVLYINAKCPQLPTTIKLNKPTPAQVHNNQYVCATKIYCNAPK